jgi:hypothetical protein
MFPASFVDIKSWKMVLLTEVNMANHKPCATCYGTGELVTEHGATTCPDCFGEARAPGRGTALEWRLRELEGQYRNSSVDGAADILWLIHELRRAREALVLILARCQDADEGDTLATDVKYRANDVLELYEKD